MTKMMNNYNLFDLVRRRPGMYFGVHSPTHLYSFLSGYFFLANSDPEELRKKILEETPNFRKFDGFVSRELGYRIHRGDWARLIEEQREDKEEALWLFFQLLDKFRGFSPNVIDEIEYKSNFHSQYKEIRNSFESDEKPIPKKLSIEEVLPSKNYLILYAYDHEDRILDRTACDNLVQIKKRAKEIYGVDEQTWNC